jgi:hypothetical protein
MEESEIAYDSERIESLLIKILPIVYRDQLYRELEIKVVINGIEKYYRKMIFVTDLDSWADLYFDVLKKEFINSVKDKRET